MKKFLATLFVLALFMPLALMAQDTAADPATFDTPDWAVVGGLPDGRPGSAAFVADLIIGDCATDTEAGVLYLESPVIDMLFVALSRNLSFDPYLDAATAGADLGVAV